MAIPIFPFLLEPASFRWQLKRNLIVNTSPNGSFQEIEKPGSLWIANLEYTDMDQAVAGELSAFIEGLGSSGGKFYLGDITRWKPMGTALGATPRVNGANQTGWQLNTIGWDINQPKLFYPGDYIQVDEELKKVTALASSDGAGNATLNITPKWRNPPAHNAEIITQDTVCAMRLDPSTNFDMTTTHPLRSAASIMAVEAID